jgi:hypothetical protein
VARTDAGSQTAHVGNRRARQQNGADHLGVTCKAGKLQSSVRGQGVSLAGLRSATIGETGLEEPDVLIVPGARIYDLVPVRELPYGPAAPSLQSEAGQMAASDVPPWQAGGVPICGHPLDASGF